MKVGFWYLVVLVLMSAKPLSAQELIANNDSLGIPFGEPLVVEAFGVLDNDTLDDESAGESDATAELIVNASHGLLEFNADGSFTYSPSITFDGSDEFMYRARFDAVEDSAWVILSACSGGPELFTCWHEEAFLAKLAELGYSTFHEGFENDLVWGDTRNPLALSWVSSQGIRWQTNHPDPPASNLISTTSGPARTGLWGIYDPDHGYATGPEITCNVDAPPDSCLFHDGFTGIREPGLGALHGVGGYVNGFHGANVSILIDGGLPLGGGAIGPAHQFFGVIDLSPTGFTRFEFRELDGKVGQALLIFGDDFTMVGSQPTAAPEPTASLAYFRGASPNPFVGSTTIHFTAPEGGKIRLAIYDLRGRLVRTMVDGVLSPGPHAIDWDARDQDGLKVSAGIYFGRLVTQDDGSESAMTRKIVVLR